MGVTCGTGTAIPSITPEITLSLSQGGHGIMDIQIKLLVFISVLVASIPPYHAYPSYQNSVPNGDKVPHPCQNGVVWSGIGHQLSKGGGALNPFGTDLLQQKLLNEEVWTRTLCNADSDGDGISNGQELGDPNCEWSRNNSLLVSNYTITHPGICDPVDSDECMKKNKWLQCDAKEFKCAAIDDPAVKMLTLRMPRTKVQQNGSMYVNTHFHVKIKTDHHVIAWKPLIDNERVLHHIVLFGCDKIEKEPVTNKPKASLSFEAPKHCKQLKVWVRGILGDCFPDQFGYLIGTNGFTRFMLQIHWVNGDNRADYCDGSGITLYYTSKLRPYNAASLTIGDTSLSLKPGLEDAKTEGVCSGLCTKRMFTGPIYVYSTYNHMHSLGRQEKVEHYRDGRLINTLRDEEDFNYKRAIETVHSSPVEILPGDELRTKCVYDTTSRNETTRFGWGAQQEMCFAFLTFYPIENVLTDHNCFSWFKVPDCILFDKLSRLRKQEEKYPLLKLGIQTYMRVFMRTHG